MSFTRSMLQIYSKNCHGAQGSYFHGSCGFFLNTVTIDSVCSLNYKRIAMIRIQIDMRTSKSKTTLLALFMSIALSAQVKTFEVDSFNEVIINPHIETVFEASDEERVVIEFIDVDMDKLNVETSGNTLEIYLDDARIYTKSEKVKKGDHKYKSHVYDGTKVKAKIYYKDLSLVSLRGEERHELLSILKGEAFKLNIYGESEVFVNGLDLEEFKTNMYGEAYLKVAGGSAQSQKVVCYGEGHVNTLAVNNRNAKVTAYGEADVKLNVSESLKVTAYGEADIHYRGNPEIQKGVILGDASIQKMN